MASIRRQPKGDAWQLRVTAKGDRIAISIPHLTEAQAEDWRVFVQAIADNLETKRPRDKAINKWLDTLSSDQRKKLSDRGLIEPDDPVEEKADPLLSDYLKEHFDGRKSEIKSSTMVAYRHTRKRLEEYFRGRKIGTITPIDAKRFRTWLETTNKRDKAKENKDLPGLALNTVRRRIGHCRYFFNQAIEDGLIEKNPFAGMKTTVRNNRDRQAYVTLEDFGKVLAKAPNARWRALLVLARIGGLRTPSEVQALRWDDIAWDAKRIAIVASSKTEHHARRAFRIVPLLPAIERELLKLHLEAEDGAEFVFPGLRADQNLRQHLLRIIKRSGLKPWPKLWQNLRASAATDFARSLPSHVAAEICGHTEQIAQEHYWQVSDLDLDQAIADLSPGIDASLQEGEGGETPRKARSGRGSSKVAQKVAHKVAHGVDSKGLNLSLPVSEGEGLNSLSPREKRAFVDLCRFVAHDDFSLRVAKAGLEPAQGLLPEGF